MPRTRTCAVLAAALIASALGVLAPTPATAAPGDYLPVMLATWKDAPGDADVASSDLVSGAVMVDPNTASFRFGSDARGYTGSTAERHFLVFGVGTRADGGACVPTWEIAEGTNGAGPIVRAAGADVWPESGSDYASASHHTVGDVAAAEFGGTTFDCATVRTERRDGTVVDSAAATATTTVPLARVRPEGTVLAGTLHRDSGTSVKIPVRIRASGSSYSVTAAGRAYDVTVDVSSDAGVVMERTHWEWPDMANDPLTSIRIPATLTPGLHTVTVRVSAGNQLEPQVVRIPVWGLGGHLAGGGDSLAGRMYLGVRSYNRPSSLESQWWQVIRFVDGQWAWINERSIYDDAVDAKFGYPARCTADAPGCVRYEYDKETSRLVVDGEFGHAYPRTAVWGGQEYRDPAFTHFVRRLAPLPRDTRLAFRGRAATYENRWTITLRKDGTFVRTTQVQRNYAGPTPPTYTQRGRYVVGIQGRLNLITRSGTRIRTSIYAIADTAGTPRPGTGIVATGVWFTPVG